MRIIVLIILEALLVAACFVWFFVFDRYFSKIIVLLADVILIILSIGTIVAGLSLRNYYLNIENQVMKEEYDLQHLTEEIESTESFESLEHVPLQTDY